ncbi:hypothetical protein [Pseudomonas yamanorum]
MSLPDTLLACAQGAIRVPICTLEAPAGWYGHPPALTPIWSDGSGPTYIGYWKHWFVDREPCFVKMYVEADGMTYEIARTPAQLFAVIAMMSMSLDDGITPELEAFADAVGLDCLAELDALSLKTGDDPKGFAQAELFKTLTPLHSMPDSVTPYSGDFPDPSNASRAWWKCSCSFEIVDRDMPTPPGVRLPAWFDPLRDKRTLFDEFIAAGRLDCAWLTLNSAGWSIADARRAIVQLQVKACDEAFDQVVAAWLAVADVDAGGY